jgi:hypothetical protein
MAATVPTIAQVLFSFFSTGISMVILLSLFCFSFCQYTCDQRFMQVPEDSWVWHKISGKEE